MIESKSVLSMYCSNNKNIFFKCRFGWKKISFWQYQHVMGQNIFGFHVEYFYMISNKCDKTYLKKYSLFFINFLFKSWAYYFRKTLVQLILRFQEIWVMCHISFYLVFYCMCLIYNRIIKRKKRKNPLFFLTYFQNNIKQYFYNRSLNFNFHSCISLPHYLNFLNQ